MKNLNQNVLIVAVILVCVWVVMKFMQGRKLRENYEMSKVDLLAYVEDEKLVPLEVMTRTQNLTDNEDFIQDAYTLAAAGKRAELLFTTNESTTCSGSRPEGKSHLIVVLAILVILVGMKRVEGMKEEEKKKKIVSLKKFL